MIERLKAKVESYNISTCIVSFAAAFIPFSISIGNAALILALVLTIFLFFKEKRKIELIKLKSFTFLFPVSFFLAVVMSTLTSKDMGAGLKQVDKNVLFLLITFLFLLLNFFGKIKQEIVLFVFSISTIISTILLIIVSIVRILYGANIDVLFFHEFGAFFGLHPVYIAINLCITIFFLSNEYLSKDKKSKHYVRLLLLIVLIIAILGLLFCASKAVILAFIPLYFLLLFQLFKKHRYRFVFLTVFILLLALIFKTPKLSERFTEGLRFSIERFEPTNNIASAKVFTNEEKELISDLELRYLMLKIGVFHLKEDKKVLFGYGIGDVQHYIDYYYMTYGLAPGWFEGYNLHNQYIQYLVSYGLFVLLMFFGYLIYSFYFALRYKNRVHLYFLILLATVFLFECLLSRNKGIVIFLFVNTMFLLNYKEQHENSNSRNKRYT